jgi:hypothetical protein
MKRGEADGLRFVVIVVEDDGPRERSPGMMEKLPAAGVGRAVAGLVIPSGYSFNLDGVALTLPRARCSSRKSTPSSSRSRSRSASSW